MHILKNRSVEQERVSTTSILDCKHFKAEHLEVCFIPGTLDSAFPFPFSASYLFCDFILLLLLIPELLSCVVDHFSWQPTSSDMRRMISEGS